MVEIHLDKEVRNRIKKVLLEYGRLCKILPQHVMKHGVKPIQGIVLDLRPLGPGLVENRECLLVPGATVFRRPEKEFRLICAMPFGVQHNVPSKVHRRPLYQLSLADIFREQALHL